MTLPSFRNFIAELPVLVDLINNELSQTTININNYEDLISGREGARDRVMMQLKERFQLYKVIHYPNIREKFNDFDQPLHGAHIEVCNPVTQQAYTMNVLQYNKFIHHGTLTYDEDGMTLGNSLVGQRVVAINLRNLIKVVEKSNLPAEIGQEIRQHFAAATAAR